MAVVAAWLAPAVLQQATALSVYALPVVGTASLLICVTVFAGWRLLPAFRTVILCFPALLLWMTLMTAAQAPAQLPESLAGGEHLLSGKVSDVRSAPVTERFLFAPDPMHVEAGWPQRIRVTWYRNGYRDNYTSHNPGSEGLRDGQYWQLTLRAKRPRGLRNPGGYNYGRAAWVRGVGATAYVRESPDNRLLSDEPGFRQQIAARITTQLGGHDATPLVLALTTGIRTSLTDRHWEALRQTGTSHLFAISGLHIGLAAGLGLLFARLILPVPGLRIIERMAGGPRGAGWLLALTIATVYAAVSGFQIPACRALLMLFLIALLSLSRRELCLSDVLARTVTLLLVLQPVAVFTLSFWLSCSAVAVLIFLTHRSRIQRPRTTGSVKAFLNVLQNAFRNTIKAQWFLVIALTPLALTGFGGVSLIAPLVNLLVIPVFAVVLVPLLLASLLLVVAGLNAGWLLTVAADLLAWLFVRLEQAGGMSAGYVEPVGTPPAIAGLTIAVLLLLAPAALPGRRFAPLFLLPLLLPATFVADEEVRVTVFDVGHGLSALVQTGNYRLLYDTGPRWQSGDAAQSVVLPALRELGLTDLDRVIVSHGDSDHSGGYASLQKGIDTGVPYDCLAGDVWTVNGVSFSVLWPPRVVSDAKNNDSCVLSIALAGQRLLFPGDIEAAAEFAVLRTAKEQLQNTVWLLLPHHGSGTSSTQSFVAALDPVYAVATAGYRNRWGFPRAEVVERYRNAGACVLSTGDTGAQVYVLNKEGITLRSTARGRRWWPWETDLRQC